jgi:hypothetical protein
MNFEELIHNLTQHLELMQVEFDIDNFGESLDSLDRLEVMEYLISYTGKDLDYLIVEVEAWKTLKSLVDEVVGSG